MAASHRGTRHLAVHMFGEGTPGLTLWLAEEVSSQLRVCPRQITCDPAERPARSDRASSRSARRHPGALLPRVAHDWSHTVWESCLVQLCGQADRQRRDPRHRYCHRGASLPSTRLLRQGDNFGNGHSVVVKINDRGPYTRGRILDLSPRAADALDMKRVGVAEVVLEFLINCSVTCAWLITYCSVCFNGAAALGRGKASSCYRFGLPRQASMGPRAEAAERGGASLTSRLKCGFNGAAALRPRKG